jgi:hypothetical protein
MFQNDCAARHYGVAFSVIRTALHTAYAASGAVISRHTITPRYLKDAAAKHISIAWLAAFPLPRSVTHHAARCSHSCCYRLARAAT